MLKPDDKYRKNLIWKLLLCLPGQYDICFFVVLP